MARLESTAKAGYYPTPPSVVERISALIRLEGHSRDRRCVDDGGRMLSVTNELGHETTFTYDDFNMPLTRTDELGNVTSWTYDAKGNLQAVTSHGRRKKSPRPHSPR